VIVATLILIVVAIIGALAVAYLLGAFTTSVSKQITVPGSPTATSSLNAQNIIIGDAALTYPIDQQLSSAYTASHREISIECQDTDSEDTNVVALGKNLTDIVALSEAPSPSTLFMYPNLESYFIGGRAIVVIANPSLNISNLSQSDLSMVYSQTRQSLPSSLHGLNMTVRNDDGKGSEAIFAQWLTNGASSSLDGYMAAPAGVSNYTASSESDVLAKVSSTPGAIGFIDWYYVANDNQVKVVPIVNKNTLAVQAPTTNSIKSEIVQMNNANYDDGLIGQLYYITNGQQSQEVSDYINWTLSSQGKAQLNNMDIYSDEDLGVSH
jgi:phosphate transport system substrate-binding protein